MKTPILALLVFLSVCSFARSDPRLEGASRGEQDGWILVHLQGSPKDIGFQHGYLLAPEIDDVLKMLAGFLRGRTNKDWDFLRDAGQKLFRPKLGEEYAQEIDGIVEGLRSRGYRYDALDLIVLNGWMELAWYYLPELAEKEKAGLAKAPLVAL